jgi:hypothetical protein
MSWCKHIYEHAERPIIHQYKQRTSPQTKMFSNLLALVVSPMLVAAQAPTPFGAIATHSGMPSVHLQSINAANGSFWIGMPTSSLCPAGILPKDCAPGMTTAFVGGNPALGLDVEVPGGQAGE